MDTKNRAKLLFWLLGVAAGFGAGLLIGIGAVPRSEWDSLRDRAEELRRHARELYAEPEARSAEQEARGTGLPGTDEPEVP